MKSTLKKEPPMKLTRLLNLFIVAALLIPSAIFSMDDDTRVSFSPETKPGAETEEVGTSSEPSEIYNIPVPKAGACPICVKSLGVGKVVTCPSGKDTFHEKCFTRWLRDHNDCPICKAPILTGSPASSSSEEESNVEVVNREAANKVDEFGMSELERAIRGKKMNAIENLVSHGADVNARGIDGVTPLIVATSVGLPDVVIFLINNRGHIAMKDFVNETDDYDISPLMYAISTGRPETVAVLLRAGADATHKTENGDSALKRATHKKEKARTAEDKKKYTDIIAALRDAGAVN